MSDLIRHIALAEQGQADWHAIAPKLEQLVKSGSFVGGDEIALLEKELTSRFEDRHVIALNSGTDALELALQIMGIGAGDEVILPCNSFVASAGAVVRVGATPVFCDVGQDRNIDPADVVGRITENTRAIMPVHLGGLSCDMDALGQIAVRHNLLILEDAAQSIGSRYKERPTGVFGNMAAFSAHPLKNLGAMGDAGFLVVPEKNQAERLRRLRNHGMEGRDDALEWGRVSRLDVLQAAILSYRLGKLDKVIAQRRQNAARYHEGLREVAGIVLPSTPDDCFNSMHTFIIQAQNRDGLRAFLLDQNIKTAIHYGRPLHLMTASRSLGYAAGDFPVAEAQAERILTLPVHEFLQEADLDRVITAIRRFCHG